MTADADPPKGMGSDAAENTNVGPTEIGLHSFGGNPAPPTVADGWRRLLGFSQEARHDFWDLIAPVLRQPADPDNQNRIEALCRDHTLAEQDAVAALQACGLLLRQASAHDLDREHFRQDLAALSNGEPGGAEVLSAKYEDMKGELRQRIVSESLIAHGKVLVGIEWRVDTVVNSDQGARLNATVILLTLRYRDGDRVERITLQLTPGALKELKLFTERISS